MKKLSLIAVITTSLFVFACKSKSDKTADDTTALKTEQTATEPSTTEPPAAAPANEPKTYTVTFSPDSATIGKKKEATIKVIPVSAVELSDPDGKAQGIEFTFKISLTNKEKIGGDRVGITPSEFRLVLDNNTSISQTNGGYFSAEPESTVESETITYRLPAGAKPKTLNLYYNETRAAVGVNLQ